VRACVSVCVHSRNFVISWMGNCYAGGRTRVSRTGKNKAFGVVVDVFCFAYITTDDRF